MNLLCLVILLAGTFLHAADWPRFRGPNGTGIDTTSTNLPTEFSPTKNNVWKSAVPFGRSSPVIVGNRLFLTASEGEMLVTLCYDTRNGRLLWRRDVKRVHNQKVFRANDAASPSATADATAVYVFFADLGLIAYTHDGKELWRHPLGPFDNFYGMSSSPVVEGETVVLLCDHNAGSFLLAVDKTTGKQRWKTERPGMAMGWSIPMIHTPASGPREVIVTGTTRIDAYYLATGERRWWFPIGSEGSMGTPVWNGDSLLVASSGHDASQPWVPPFPETLGKYDTDKDGKLSSVEFQAYKDWAEHFGWIDADKNGFIDAAEWKTVSEFGTGEYGVVSLKPGSTLGQLPATATTWRMKKNLPYVPAPVLYKGVYYMVKDGGIVTSLNPETGEVLKQGRAATSLGEYLASPVAGDGKIYLLSEEGKLTVLKAGGEWEVITVNDMGEESYATPAIKDGRIYVRTKSMLYCFGK